MTLTGCGGRKQSQKESKAEGLQWAAQVAGANRPGMS